MSADEQRTPSEMTSSVAESNGVAAPKLNPPTIYWDRPGEGSAAVAPQTSVSLALAAARSSAEVAPRVTRIDPVIKRPNLLQVQDLHVDLGQPDVLQGVDLQVREGEVTTLLGADGAGKTTTLRAIMGQCKVKSGKITLRGTELVGLSPPHVARTGIGYVPEDAGIFNALTVAENLKLGAVSGRIRKSHRDWIFSVFPELKKHLKLPAGWLPESQRQLLSLARAVVEKRRLYLIDEPKSGFVPSIGETVTRCLRDLKLQGGSILFVQRNIELSKEFGDRAVVLKGGKSVWTGDMDDLAKDQQLQERLIGSSKEQIA